MSPIRSTVDFLRGSLDLLRDESLDRYDRVAAELRGAAGRHEVSGERFTLRAAEGVVLVEPGWRAGHAVCTARLTAGAIVQLVDGTTTVERLLADETLLLKGTADALLALAAALRVFMEGAALSDRQQRWFEAYREAVRQEATVRTRRRAPPPP